jgi:hypothetical protein
VSIFAKAHTVADVFDRYDVKNSIKLAERERCTNTKVFQVIEGRNIPDWKKFLSVKENKQALIIFFGDSIVKFNQSNPLVPPGNLYYIVGSFGNPEIVKVWKSDAASFSILYTNVLPFLKKEEVVLHPERACAPGRTTCDF